MHRLARLGCAALSGALAGCALFDQPRVAEPADAGRGAGQEIVAPPPEQPIPQREVAAPSLPAPAALEARAPPPTPDMESKDLVGLDEQRTIALFGRPASVREQPPSTVWLYRAKDCALELFFFMDLGSRTFRVLTYELRTTESHARARNDCLARFQAASRER
jgi:hypothetical protein